MKTFKIDSELGTVYIEAANEDAAIFRFIDEVGDVDGIANEIDALPAGEKYL